ncbi:FAD-dependent oxidoreductase [Adlercreutzia sp. R7]|uniref:FAD-dependent oxidoreductase n=1 Tax=Adlercreutzia wanghongyangiae TaxID=3111451 RepID=A0ABU6IHA3_9ACTN|nr:FAD-dependent oxidoreductase [Adlercreutzia sp. R7]
MTMDQTRRTFLKSGAIAGAAVALGALAGCSPQEKGKEGSELAQTAGSNAEEGSEALPESADLSATVLVIGSGIAGTVAALEAAERGMDVLLVEKSENLGGTSALCSGAFMAAGTTLTQSSGVTLTVNDFYNTLISLDASSTTDRDIIQRFAFNAASACRFLEDHGVTFTELTSPRLELPAISHMTEGGSVVMETLGAHLSDKGVTVETGLRVTDLVKDESGRMIGAWGEQAGDRVSIRSPYIILATGGFASAQEMLAKHATPLLLSSSTMNPNTGDGYRLAKAAGSAMLDTDAAIVTTSDTQGENWVGAFSEDLFYVTDEGERYCDESISTFDRSFIMMARGITTEYIIATESQYEAFKADFDSAAADGRSFSSDDPRELARQMGIDPDRFAQTVQRYNELCDKGVDEDYGKDSQYLTKLEGPLHSLTCAFDLTDTASGPRINKNAQVISIDGTPIEGLYAAGAVTMAQLFGHAYIGTGSSMTNGAVFGRAAAQHISQIKDIA